MDIKYKELNNDLNKIKIRNKDLLYRLQKNSFRDFVKYLNGLVKVYIKE